MIYLAPNDVLFEIMRHLKPSEIMALAQVCRRFAVIWRANRARLPHLAITKPSQSVRKYIIKPDIFLEMIVKDFGPNYLVIIQNKDIFLFTDVMEGQSGTSIKMYENARGSSKFTVRSGRILNYTIRSSFIKKIKTNQDIMARFLEYGCKCPKIILLHAQITSFLGLVANPGPDAPTGHSPKYPGPDAPTGHSPKYPGPDA